jgi:membrane protein YqaA with SNARE-associated domain
VADPNCTVPESDLEDSPDQFQKTKDRASALVPLKLISRHGGGSTVTGTRDVLDVAVLVDSLAVFVGSQIGDSFTSIFRHLGALGLFSLAIVDSSPLPTFGGPDILTAILAASHRNPWYEYAAVATAGSVIGAYLTFRLARKAGSAYLHSKFAHRKYVTHSSRSSPITLDAISSVFCAIRPDIGAGYCCSRRSSSA